MENKPELDKINTNEDIIEKVDVVIVQDKQEEKLNEEISKEAPIPSSSSSSSVTVEIKNELREFQINPEDRVERHVSFDSSCISRNTTFVLEDIDEPKEFRKNSKESQQSSALPNNEEDLEKTKSTLGPRDQSNTFGMYVESFVVGPDQLNDSDDDDLMNNPASNAYKDHTKRKKTKLFRLLQFLRLSVMACFVCVYSIKKRANCNQPLILWSLGVAGIMFTSFLISLNHWCDSAIGPCYRIISLLIWFIVGNLWITNTDRSQCDELLYLFCFWMLILAHVVLYLSIITWLCMGPCYFMWEKIVEQKKRAQRLSISINNASFSNASITLRRGVPRWEDS